ncbi:DUF5672 family protein [Sphingomonas sp. RS6]
MTKPVDLSSVTLCAVTSTNIAATVAALRVSMRGATFARVLLITDAEIGCGDGIDVVKIPKIDSAKAYSLFILKELVNYISTGHALLVQWDGFVINPHRWEPQFLDYDYIGAIWPHHDHPWNMGNGGFSLRSRALLEACAAPDFKPSHPEDLSICQANRALLENGKAFRFAPEAVARRFSYERERVPNETFGFHGAFNLPREVDPASFFRMYRSLDDRKSVYHDKWKIAAGLVSRGANPVRVAALLHDGIKGRRA